jgi:hypothetical protein
MLPLAVEVIKYCYQCINHGIAWYGESGFCSLGMFKVRYVHFYLHDISYLNCSILCKSVLSYQNAHFETAVELSFSIRGG